MKKPATLQDLLEAQIDANGLASVLQAISDVCYGKASHLESNWQDAKSAKVWEKAGNAIDRASANNAVSAC